ncbi:MFS transporter [Cellvibrio mixtus]|uniref:MFS transporter n=1 Tax=Cellvibrio mixtus TaxID=39650 RepID=UPI0005869660|nr:MFS transporter [Cellvibrio mixtus]
MSSHHLKLLDFSNKSVATLHFTWFAFFLTFVMWFSLPPLKPLITASFAMSPQQWAALLTLNVALTIPARIVVGSLVDKFGPRAIYSVLLMFSGLLLIAFASAQTYEQLALFRFLLGFVGAGFVIGIRLVSEWFPARQVGLAEGIYGGWGNFGAAAAGFTLPFLAIHVFGGVDGWRYAMGTAAIIAMIYGVAFYLTVRNTPKGSTYFKPKKSGGLEVSSKKDFVFYVIMNVPMYLILAVLAWKMSPTNLGLLSDATTYGLYVVLLGLFIFQFSQIYRVNKEMLKNGAAEHDKYEFKQVAILSWAYLATFGSEIAVVSVLPAFFMTTFTGLSVTQAAMLGGSFAFMNLVARPGGGWVSDKFGRRLSMTMILAGVAAGYLLLSQINASWPLYLAFAAVFICSLFVQAGCGAVFAVVPLIKRRMTGQIAGLAGAYGNTGALFFLTMNTFIDIQSFFFMLAGAAAIGLIFVQFLKEPKGHVVEVNEDGSLHRIEVS